MKKKKIVSVIFVSFVLIATTIIASCSSELEEENYGSYSLQEKQELECLAKEYGLNLELDENIWNKIYNESITSGNEYPDMAIYKDLLNNETGLDIHGWPFKNTSALKSSDVVTNGNRYVLFQNNTGTNVKHALALKSVAYRTFNNGFFRNTSYYRYCTYNPTSGGYRYFKGSSFFDAAYIFK